MSAMWRNAAIALVVLRASAAAPDEPKIPHWSTNARAASEIQKADAALATEVLLDGLARGLAGRVAADVVLLEPRLALLQGAEAARALGGSRPRVTSRRLALFVLAVGASQDGTLGYAFGQYAPRERGTTEHGKYLAVWRSTPDGWRLAAFVRAPGKRRSEPVERELLASNRGAARASPGEPARLAAEVIAADSAFARRADSDGPCVAFPAFADANAVVFGAGDFGWGLEAVRRAWSDCGPGDGLRFAPVRAGAASSGDLGWSTGNATFSSRDAKGGVTRRYTKYLTVWVRDRDGAWKWLLDTGNARPADAANVPRR